METATFDLIEEYQSEDIMSLNHSYLTYTTLKALGNYDTQYSIMPELEFELVFGRAKPDVSICNKMTINWFDDVVRPKEPPIVAIEILSPKQGLADLTDKFKIYFPSGVQSIWVIIPTFREIQIITPDLDYISFQKKGLLKDPVTGFEMSLDVVFGNSLL